MASETLESLEKGVLYPAYAQSTFGISRQSGSFEAVFWVLPGSNSESTNSWCGIGWQVRACPEHRESPKRIVNHCKNPLCPTCGEYWASRSASRVENRLQGVHDAYMKVSVSLGAVKHIILSPPQEWAKKLMATRDGYHSLRQYAYRVLKNANILGGCVIFHAHRFGHPENDDLHDTRKKAYISPHFHVLGWGFLQPAGEFHRETAGWVYKNKGKRDSVGGTVAYLLSHAGIGFHAPQSHFNTPTWFGCASYNRVSKSTTLTEKITPTCEICGEKLHLYGVHPFTPDDAISWTDAEDLGIYVEHRKCVRYSVRSKRIIQVELSGFESNIGSVGSSYIK